MNTPPSTPASSRIYPSRELRAALRIPRAAALVGLALIATLLLGLALLSSFSSLNEAIARAIFEANRATTLDAAMGLVGFIVLVPIALLVLAWRLRLRSWWWIGGGYLATAPVLVYLAVDDATIRRPVSIDEVSPAFPGAEKSYEVLMRYGKSHPLGRDFNAPKRIFEGKGPSVTDNRNADQWRAALLARRAEIEADWADLAPVRAWWTELATYDRIGDLTPTRLDAEIMAFAPVRSYSQHAIAIAGLQAIEGQGDAAIATLLPALQVGRRLQPSARTLVRFMIGIVIEKMTVQTANFILDQATVSPEMKAKLASALQGGCRGEAGARRLVGIEYSLQLGAMLDKPLGEMFAIMKEYGKDPKAQRRVLNALSPFVYNPRRTFNLMGEVNSRLQDLAARRAPLTGAQADVIFADLIRPRFKNFAGPILASAVTPAYSKVVQSYWDLQDQRDALAARLAPKP